MDSSLSIEIDDEFNDNLSSKFVDTAKQTYSSKHNIATQLFKCTSKEQESQNLPASKTKETKWLLLVLRMTL